jgi:luciferase family oxidoreductase group 1
MKQLKYSVLDLASNLEGTTISDTYAYSVALAQHVEKLGYERFWLAEHHNMISQASAATSILIGHIAGKTSHIRVGAGGIMLPNHTPLIIAEQFGTLAHLYPGRIDLGLGRAPGSDQLTAYEIRGERYHSPQNFPQDVRKLLYFLGNESHDSKVRAIPGEGTNVPIWILGSSTDSAHLAAAYGLPYAFASHFAPAHCYEALAIYRREFRPSRYLKDPYTMACINVIAADDTAEAYKLSTTLKRLFLGVVTGQLELLKPPVDNLLDYCTEGQLAAVEQMLAFTFIGNQDKITPELQQFVEHAKVDEIMVSAHMYDQQARLRSYEIAAESIKSIS